MAVILTGIFLPYVHGDYDYFAVGLSYIFQFASFASLLLVPVGLVWCLLNIVKRKNQKAVRYPFYLRKITFAVIVIIILAAALGAFTSNNRFSAIIIIGMGVIITFMFRKQIMGMGLRLPPTNVIPYYLIFIPLTVWLIRMACLENVKNKSTEFVIKQSKQVIHDIEAYKKANDHYPVSLLSTIEDYKPSVAGIQRFHYELNGSTYNLYFEQLSDMLGTQEIVMYNKLGEHEMTVHNQDILRIAPQNILRGYHKVADHQLPHWKIFYFD